VVPLHTGECSFKSHLDCTEEAPQSLGSRMHGSFQGNSFMHGDMSHCVGSGSKHVGAGSDSSHNRFQFMGLHGRLHDGKAAVAFRSELGRNICKAAEPPFQEFMREDPTLAGKNYKSEKRVKCTKAAREDAAAPVKSGKSAKEYSDSQERCTGAGCEEQEEQDLKILEMDPRMAARDLSHDASFVAARNGNLVRLLESEAELESKLVFAEQATQEDNPFKSDVQLPVEVLDAVDWIASRSEQEEMAEREHMVERIESFGSDLWEAGEVADWMLAADEDTKQISEEVNGPLFETMAEFTKFVDGDTPEVFRHGASVVGTLTCSGLGTPKCYPAPKSVDELAGSCYDKNVKLLKSLRPVPESHAVELLTQLEAETKSGRMSGATAVEELDLSSVLLARRFGVDQGSKLRAVDDETANEVNQSCQPTEQLHNDSVDAFIELIKCFYRRCGVRPSLFKADVDAAYRRIPAKLEHRWLLWIVFMVGNTVVAARHNSMCFGATASVHAWNRVGGLITHIARKLLHIPLLRYVDDMFSLDRPACVAHSLECLARVVRALMGRHSLQPKKMSYGLPLVVLGVEFDIQDEVVKVFPSEDKIAKWSAALLDVDNKQQLFAGEAGKFAGRLAFASQLTFSRLGRAMLRPFFAQQHAPLRKGALGPLLKLAVKWWLTAFKLNMRREICVYDREGPTFDLFCDARGHPARVAAVLFFNGNVVYTDWQPSPAVLGAFSYREDNQIMGLELLAILVGLITFADILEGYDVRIWTDNAGGEGALRKGASKSTDHNLLVHGTWLFAAKHRIGMFVKRVGTKENCADDPSREDYRLLSAIGAAWTAPKTIPQMAEPLSWAKWAELTPKEAA